MPTDAINSAEIERLKKSNGVLLEAATFALEKLSNMTTEQFELGGDKPIRLKLVRAIAEGGTR